MPLCYKEILSLAFVSCFLNRFGIQFTYHKFPPLKIMQHLVFCDWHPSSSIMFRNFKSHIELTKIILVFQQLVF